MVIMMLIDMNHMYLDRDLTLSARRFFESLSMLLNFTVTQFYQSESLSSFMFTFTNQLWMNF